MFSNLKNVVRNILYCLLKILPICKNFVKDRFDFPENLFQTVATARRKHTTALITTQAGIYRSISKINKRVNDDIPRILKLGRFPIREIFCVFLPRFYEVCKVSSKIASMFYKIYSKFFQLHVQNTPTTMAMTEVAISRSTFKIKLVYNDIPRILKLLDALQFEKYSIPSFQRPTKCAKFHGKSRRFSRKSTSRCSDCAQKSRHIADNGGSGDIPIDFQD